MGWNRGWIKKSLLSAAAAATVVVGAAPAMAGGGGGGGYYYGHPGRGHYKQRPVHLSNHYYYGSKSYRHRHHRGGLSGGEAALLAAGLVGGIILIDRARERDRYASSAYPPRYDRYPPSRDDRYRRDNRPYGDGRYDDRRSDGRDDRYGALEGGRAAPGEYNYGAAYNDCKAETREAGRESGVTVALPAKPERIVPIEGGGAVRFEASYLASDSRGGERRRQMVCEADEQGVRFLELI